MIEVGPAYESCRAASANSILQGRIGYLRAWPIGRLPNEVRRYYANFTYQAGSDQTGLRTLTSRTRVNPFFSSTLGNWIAAGLSSAMEQLGPYRSTETFASPLHCAPSSQVPPIAKAPNARDSVIKKTLRLPR